MILGTVVLAIGLNSCNVSDDTDFVCPEDFSGALLESENDLLGKWELTAIVADKEVDITKDSENNPKTDIYVQYSECERDNNMVFSSDRAYTNSQGQNAENCTNKAKFNGTWQIKDNVLSLLSNCYVQKLQVEFNEEKTAYSYKGNYTITDVHGVQIQTDVTFTYTKAADDLEPAE